MDGSLPRVIWVPASSSALRNFAGDLAGEMHVEAELADPPGDEVAGVGKVDGEKAVEGEAGRLRGDEVGGAAIGEDEEGENLLEVVGLLQVQRSRARD